MESSHLASKYSQVRFKVMSWFSVTWIDWYIKVWSEYFLNYTRRKERRSLDVIDLHRFLLFAESDPSPTTMEIAQVSRILGAVCECPLIRYVSTHTTISSTL
jgi:hypothetical protein